MNTIVTSFLSNVNNKYHDTLNRYSKFGKLLLKSRVPKIIYVDEEMFNLIADDYDKNNTLIIKITKQDLYLYDYLEHLTQFEINSTDYNKDTIEFMFTMCNKTEWIRNAILLNHFKTENFIWIDFGIRHIFNDDNDFIEHINALEYKIYDNVRIGGIWNIDYDYNNNIYKDVLWYFAGGVFGGNQKALIKFADLMKEKCITIMTTKNTIMWEVNIWYLIYIENKELFNIYKCDHNSSLVFNY